MLSICINLILRTYVLVSTIPRFEQSDFNSMNECLMCWKDKEWTGYCATGVLVNFYNIHIGLINFKRDRSYFIGGRCDPEFVFY